MSPPVIEIVGGVPDPVLRALAAVGCNCLQVSDLSDVAANLVVIQADDYDNNPTEIEDFLNCALSDERRVALTTARRVDSRLAYLLFHPAVLPMMPLNLPDGQARDGAIDLFVAGSLNPDPVTTGDVKIGRYFDKPRTHADYREQRFVALVSPSMQPCLMDIRDAVDSMSLPFPLGVPTVPHWNPDDEGQPVAVQPGQTAPQLDDRSRTYNLFDIYAAHRQPLPQELMRATHPGLAEAGEWRPPHLLIQGESGSGKTLIADYVYELLARRRGSGKRMPRATVNCGGMSADNLDHALFGAPPDVFTDVGTTVGSMARAAYGMAFFDEIGDLTMEAQKRLLVFLGDRIVRPFAMRAFPSYALIVAATNRDLSYLIRQDRFRNDLYERFLKQVTIPSMRERDETERERLIDFVALNPATNPPMNPYVTHIGEDAMRALKACEFSNGNFRELERVIDDGIGRAYRRGSKILRKDDLRFSEASALPDREERTVRMQDSRGLEAMPIVSLRTLQDIERLAALTGSPLLKGEERQQVVLLHEGVRYTFQESGNDSF